MKKSMQVLALLSLSGALISPVSGTERFWTYSYNDKGQVLSADGPRTEIGDKTHYAYDENSYLTSITNALGHTTQIIDYNANGQPETIIDVNGIATQLTYNWRGQVVTQTLKSVQGNVRVIFEYDLVGLLTKITQPDGSYVQFQYDAAKRLVAVTNSLDERIEYSHDNMGNRLNENIKNAGLTLVKTKTNEFDELGRLIKEVGAGFQSTQYGYDRNSNLIKVTDAKLNTNTRQFDALNRLIEITDALNGKTKFGFDSQDNMISVTDPRGLITHYEYNYLGDNTKRVSPDTGETQYEYDTAGNMVKKTDARGVVANYEYDNLNRLTRISYPQNTSENIVYSYDSLSNGNQGVGRLTRISDQTGMVEYFYDDRGNVIKETRLIEDIIYTTEYSYNLANKLVSMTYPSGRVLNYSYNTNGQIDGITTQSSQNATPQSVVHSIQYMPFGPIKSLTYGNGITKSVTYDQDYQLTDLSSLVLSRNISYDTLGNISAISDSLDVANDQSFDYDELSRLNQATGQYGTINYGYDEVGNRLSRNLSNGSQSKDETYHYEAVSNKLTKVETEIGANSSERALSYLANGNIDSDQNAHRTLALVYSDQNRLEEIKKDGVTLAVYLHNASGQRVIKVAQDPSANMHFHYDKNGLLIAEGAPDGNIAKETVYLGSTPVAQLVGNSSGKTDITLVASNPQTQVAENTPYQYQIEVIASDNSTVTTTLLNAPSGMALDSQTMTLSWQPGIQDLGFHLVEVLVSDSDGQSYKQSFTVNVHEFMVPTEPPMNQVQGTEGEDTLTGLSERDLLIGGKGNDSLNGASGDDIYAFNLGDGNDTIAQDDATGRDGLRFGPNIALTDLYVSRIGDDLLIELLISEDSILVENWFQGVQYQLEYLEFDDGTEKLTNDWIFESVDIVNSVEVLNGTIGWTYDESKGGFSPNLTASVTTSISTASDLLDPAKNYNVKLTEGLSVTNTSRIEAQLTGYYNNPSSGVGVLYAIIEYTDGTVGWVAGYKDTYTSSTVGGSLYNNGESVYYKQKQNESNRAVYYDVPREKRGMVKDVWLHGSGLNGYPISVLGIKNIRLIISADNANSYTGISNGTDDIVVSTAENEVLDAGLGDDTYLFNIGWGQDKISHLDMEGFDTIQFGSGIAASELYLSRKANDLLIEIKSSSDFILVEQWFDGTQHQIDQIKFDDQTTLSTANWVFDTIDIANNSSSLETSAGWTFDATNGGFGPALTAPQVTYINSAADLVDSSKPYSTRISQGYDVTNLSRIEANLTGYYNSPSYAVGILYALVEYADGSVVTAAAYRDAYTSSSVGGSFYMNGVNVYYKQRNNENNTAVYIDIPEAKRGQVKDVWLHGSGLAGYPITKLGIKDIRFIIASDNIISGQLN